MSAWMTDWGKIFAWEYIRAEYGFSEITCACVCAGKLDKVVIDAEIFWLRIFKRAGDGSKQVR